MGKRRIGPLAAAAVLGVVVVVVGAVGYVVLSAVSHTATTSAREHSCTPATSPECRGLSNATESSSSAGLSLAAPRG